MNEVLDITGQYLISKTSGEEIRDKQYRVLNLLHSPNPGEYNEKVIALIYGAEVGRQTGSYTLYEDILHTCKTKSLDLPSSDDKEPDGLYNKYHIKTLDGKPITFPAFVLSMVDPIVLSLKEKGYRVEKLTYQSYG